MFPIRKYVRPLRQVGAAGIDQINAGQPVLAGDFLRPQMLLHRQRIIGTALDGRIVAYDHAFPAGYATDASDDAGRMNRVVVEAVGGKRRQFQERRTGVNQRQYAVARQELSARQMALTRARGSAFGCLAAPRLQFRDQCARCSFIRAELCRRRIDAGC